MSAIYEITSSVEVHVQRSHWYRDVQDETRANDYQMEHGADAVIDNIADDVWSDLDVLIEGWLDRHGERYKDELRRDVEKVVSEEEDDE